VRGTAERGSRRMAERNRTRLRQFDDPEMAARLLRFPGEHLKRALRCRTPCAVKAAGVSDAPVSRRKSLDGLEVWIAEQFRRHSGNADVVRQELATESR
jgi:hypothetical protein